MATQNTSGTGRRKATAQQREARKKRKIIIFTVEIIVILVMLGALYMIVRHTEENEGNKYYDKYANLEATNPDDLREELKEELSIQDKVDQEKEEGGTMHGYMNIALFGLDAGSDILEPLDPNNPTGPHKSYSESQLEKLMLKGSRSDTIMIASINMDSGDIRLVSVYRDTYLNVGTQYSDGSDKYTKCNAAYAEGGAAQAMKMLNMNLDMDIEDFVAVGFEGMVDLIDGIGGVWIDVDSEELKYINGYQLSIATLLKCDYQTLNTSGYQLLNGVQATAYCRIRQTAGSDFMRTSRQREVLKAVEAQAKKMSYTDLVKVFNNVIDDVYTSFKPEDLLEHIKNIANYQIVDEGGFPQENLRTTANLDAKGSCVIPMDLEKNVIWLHQFLFEDPNYVVTDNVLEYSRQIQKDVSGYVNKNN